MRPFCPPVTTGYCAGTILIRQASNHQTLAHLKFKLAPGQLGTLTFRLSKTLTKLLKRSRRVTLTSTITAHDAAKHHKTTSATTSRSSSQNRASIRAKAYRCPFEPLSFARLTAVQLSL